MAKPIKSVTKAAGKAVKAVVSPVAKPVAEAILPKPTAQMAGQQVAAAQEAEKVSPKSAVSLGGEDQMRGTRQQARRRRAAGVVTGARGLTGSARTERKSLLGQ